MYIYLYNIINYFEIPAFNLIRVVTFSRRFVEIFF